MPCPLQARSTALDGQVASLSSANTTLQARVGGLEEQLQQSAARFTAMQTQARACVC